MPLPRALAALLGLAVLAPAVALAPATAGADTPIVTTYVGQDGKDHQPAGWTVRGKRGTLYFGQDMDYACRYGAELEGYIKQLAGVARMIEKSGRRVVFTVGPNKSAVNKKDLRARNLPNGACDANGIKAQDKVLDTFKDPNYVPLRKPLLALANSGQQPYWRMDSHWNTVGNTRWSQALAARLDPALAARQKFVRSKRTVNPDIAFLQGDTETHETAPARLLRTNVEVTPVPGTEPYDVTIATAFDHAWTSTPAKSTWPGRTLLLGDSFSYVTLESLRPLFHRGRFLWLGHTETETVVAAILKADTVVLQVVQRWAPISPLIATSFRRDLRRALR